MTFMYWWTNMCQRIKALGAKKWFVKDNPKATGYTADDIKQMSVPMLSKKLVGNLPPARTWDQGKHHTVAPYHDGNCATYRD